MDRIMSDGLERYARRSRDGDRFGGDRSANLGLGRLAEGVGRGVRSLMVSMERIVLWCHEQHRQRCFLCYGSIGFAASAAFMIWTGIVH